MSKYPHLRQPPEGHYRIIEIDTKKQNWLRELLDRVGELEYTVVIGDYADWDEAVGVLKKLTNRHCRRLMWSERGCVGQNDQGNIWTFDPFR